MQTSTAIGIGVGVAAAAVVTGGLIAAARAANDDSPIDPATDYPPVGEPVPGSFDGPTSPGDDPYSTPVRGQIDPPGWWNDYQVDGAVRGTQLDAQMDPPGWLNEVQLSGRVDYSGFDTRIDPRGWGNDTTVVGARTSSGFTGTVDRPGLWNDVRHSITETVRGAQVVREGRFDETLVPSFMEASWRSEPVGTGGGARRLTFDPPGWGNDTRVDLEGNPPAGVEATIAAHLFNEWRIEQERQDDYPDPGYPDPTYPDPSYPSVPGGPTGPGDDSGYPTSPGDDGYPY